MAKARLEWGSGPTYILFSCFHVKHIKGFIAFFRRLIIPRSRLSGPAAYIKGGSMNSISHELDIKKRIYEVPKNFADAVLAPACKFNKYEA